MVGKGGWVRGVEVGVVWVVTFGHGAPGSHRGASSPEDGRGLPPGRGSRVSAPGPRSGFLASSRKRSSSVKKVEEGR